MSTDEYRRDEMAQAYHEIGPELLHDYGGEAGGERRGRVQESQQNRSEVRIESSETGLQRKHRQCRCRDGNVTQQKSRAVSEYSFSRWTRTRRCRTDSSDQTTNRRRAGRGAHRLTTATAEGRGSRRSTGNRRIRCHVLRITKRNHKFNDFAINCRYALRFYFFDRWI